MENFLPLLGYVAMGLWLLQSETSEALYRGEDPPDWRGQVIEKTGLHPSFLEYAEQSVNWQEERREQRLEVESMLASIMRSTFPIPIYLSGARFAPGPRVLESLYVHEADDPGAGAFCERNSLRFSRWAVNAETFNWYEDPFIPPPKRTSATPNRSKSRARTSVPAAPFPRLPPNSQQKKGETIQAFFIRQSEGNRKKMANESPVDRQRRTSRAAHAQKARLRCMVYTATWPSSVSIPPLVDLPLFGPYPSYRLQAPPNYGYTLNPPSILALALHRASALLYRCFAFAPFPPLALFCPFSFLRHLPLFERCIPPTGPPRTLSNVRPHASAVPATLTSSTLTRVLCTHMCLGTRSRPTAPAFVPTALPPIAAPRFPRSHAPGSPPRTYIRLSPVPTHPFACPVGQSLALLTSVGVVYSPRYPHTHKTACAAHMKGAPRSVSRIPARHLRRRSARLSCPHTFHTPRSERPLHCGLRAVRFLTPTSSSTLALHRTRSQHPLACTPHAYPTTYLAPRCPLAPFPHIASPHLARISCSRVGLEFRREDVA
ncbi:hypothetical protein B0H14DRAFT_3519541 [Mycena olivaceomarginata]|nr:hypothetical protein B0H14DRAFT_3519541 [Mycena olivaceomarginata]